MKTGAEIHEGLIPVAESPVRGPQRIDEFLKARCIGLGQTAHPIHNSAISPASAGQRPVSNGPPLCSAGDHTEFKSKSLLAQEPPYRNSGCGAIRVNPVIFA